MSAETKKVLEMMAEGKITADEAEKLLDKLGPSSAADAKLEAESAPGQRYLRILVDKPGHDQINIRMPLSLLRTSKLIGILPLKVSSRLAEQGIDLSALCALKNGELADALQNLNLNVERGDGKKVRIYCE